MNSRTLPWRRWRAYVRAPKTQAWFCLLSGVWPLWTEAEDQTKCLFQSAGLSTSTNSTQTECSSSQLMSCHTSLMMFYSSTVLVDHPQVQHQHHSSPSCVQAAEKPWWSSPHVKWHHLADVCAGVPHTSVVRWPTFPLLSPLSVSVWQSVGETEGVTSLLLRLCSGVWCDWRFQQLNKWLTEWGEEWWWWGGLHLPHTRV